MSTRSLFETDPGDAPPGETTTADNETASAEVTSQIRSEDADEAFAQTLSCLLDCNSRVVGGKTLSIGSGKECHEILNFTTIISNPRNRLIYNSARRLTIPAAVARFVWMMAGSDRLADIAYYEPKVNAFTDDNVSVPGSNYGQRILHPRPGLNQLNAVIERLKEDPQSRRAAISIYHPEDAVRNSKDIPCTFGVFYHIRNGSLHATTIMRSNNAFILLPYNVFEFSLLAEVVAVEVGVPLGTLTHFAASMHIYEEHLEGSRKVVATYKTESKPESVAPIPTMPADPKPLEQINKLVILEAEIRHGLEGLTGGNIEEWITKGEQMLNAYWRQYYYLLLLYAVTRKSTTLKANPKQQEIALSALESVIEEPWKSYLPTASFDVEGKAVSSAEELVPLDLVPRATGGQVVLFHNAAAHKKLQEQVAKYEAKTKTTVDWRKFQGLQVRFADRIAARDGRAVEFEEVENALNELQGDDKK